MGLLANLSPDLALCSATDPDPVAQAELERLNEALRRFYNSQSADAYFHCAEEANARWTAAMPGHRAIRAAIPRGSRVIDLGCGTGHAWRNLRDLEIHYTGVDWSAAQIDQNRREMPAAEFVCASLYDVPLPKESFDVAISLYVIEHLVWPHRFLAEIHRLVRPGGLIAILTPPFRARRYLKSFDYGFTARPFAEKVRSGAWLDALFHAVQHRVIVPLKLRERRREVPRERRFLINLRPVCLTHGTWFPDADAVYLADIGEIIDYLEHLGGTCVEARPRLAYCLVRRT